MLNSWTGLKIQFLQSALLIETLMQIYPREEYYETVNNLLIQLLEQSVFARELESKTLKHALEDYYKFSQV